MPKTVALLEIYVKKGIYRYLLLYRSRLLLFTSDLSFQKGFTLIEYLVALTILATLIGGVLLTLDPFSQIQKGDDAGKRHDIQQIKNALEAYYQDHNCYPESLEFGQEWQEGDTVYMKHVPQDATCNDTSGSCYQYITDSEANNSCPQWNVVFAKLSQKPTQNTSICPLSDISSTCVPEGYDETWACTMSGAVNCQFMAVSGFGYDSGVEPTGVVSGTPTPTGVLPTPTLAEGSATYTVGGGFLFNPYLRQVAVSPLWAMPDTAQTFMVTVQDSTADIASVRLHLFSDNLSQVLTLSHSGGTLRNGTWSGTISADTYNEKFVMAIVAENASSQSRCTVLTPRGSDAAADAICDQVNQ